MTSEWGYYNINTFTSVTIYWLGVETMLILFILLVFSKFIIIYYKFMFLQIFSFILKPYFLLIKSKRFCWHYQKLRVEFKWQGFVKITMDIQSICMI